MTNLQADTTSEMVNILGLTIHVLTKHLSSPSDNEVIKRVASVDDVGSQFLVVSHSHVMAVSYVPLQSLSVAASPCLRVAKPTASPAPPTCMHNEKYEPL